MTKSVTFLTNRASTSTNGAIFRIGSQATPSTPEFGMVYAYLLNDRIDNGVLLMVYKVSQLDPPGLRPSVKPKAEDPYDAPWLDHPFKRKPRFEPGAGKPRYRQLNEVQKT